MRFGGHSVVQQYQKAGDMGGQGGQERNAGTRTAVMGVGVVLEVRIAYP
jgi:hypothetical protein